MPKRTCSRLPVSQARADARRMAPHTDVYHYLLSYSSGLVDRWAPHFGAHHAAEIPYVFNVVRTFNRQEDFDMATIFTTYWTSLAKNGDPNAHDVEAVPTWPLFLGGNGALTQEMVHPPAPIVDIKDAECDLWDSYGSPIVSLESFPWHLFGEPDAHAF